jgi:hypothetical protein
VLKQIENIEQEVSEPQMAILESIANVNLFLAGTGSGKTHLGGILAINFIKQFPEVRGAIFANTFDQLNTSTLFRIREYWSSIGVTEWSKENPNGTYISGKEPPAQWTKCKRNFDRFNNIISFCNGGLIFTGSLDNYMSHSGKEFGFALLDETKDTKEEALKEVIITRLRQPGIYIVNGQVSHTGIQSQQWNPLYCLTSPARVDWLNELFELEKYIDEISAKIYSDKTFFEKEFNNKKVVISSTYHNVHNVGINYINNILANNSTERGKALVYANPFSISGGEFYSSFNRLTHVSKAKYNPEIPIHISFDQNTVPYNSASIWQIVGKDNIWYIDCVDEIALVNPRNSTEEVCEEFALRYANHKAGLYYYGDASGKARSTMNRDFKHHYEIVEYKLRSYLVNNSDRTMTKNPSIVKRRDFVNLIFEGKLPIRISIGESCKYLIGDLMYLKQALDGTKDKHIVTDKESGEKYQKYGHLSDGMDYILTDLFKSYYNG